MILVSVQVPSLTQWPMMSRWNGPAGWSGLTLCWQEATLGLVTAKEGCCSGGLHSSVLNRPCSSWSPSDHHIKASQDFLTGRVLVFSHDISFQAKVFSG